MNLNQVEERSQNHVAPKKSYSTPAVSTFGSVANLTHGTHSAGNDGLLGHTKNSTSGGGNGHH